MARVGFIGAGNMATAIASGMIRSGTYKASDLYIYDVSEERQTHYRNLGAHVMDTVEDVAKESEYLFLSVKPQTINDVLPSVKANFTPDKVIVSIAAGISSDYIKKRIGFDCKVVLVMPNTPLMVGQGACSIAQIAPVTDSEFATVRAMFDCSGRTAVVPENKIPETIPLNGSSPAVFYLLAKIAVEYAVKTGITADAAMTLFTQSMIGAAHMLTETNYTADELIRMVCSPGGTTLKGLESLENDNITQVMGRSFDAMVNRAYEMRKEFEG